MYNLGPPVVYLLWSGRALVRDCNNSFPPKGCVGLSFLVTDDLVIYIVFPSRFYYTPSVSNESPNECSEGS